MCFDGSSDPRTAVDPTPAANESSSTRQLHSYLCNELRDVRRFSAFGASRRTVRRKGAVALATVGVITRFARDPISLTETRSAGTPAVVASSPAINSMLLYGTAGLEATCVYRAGGSPFGRIALYFFGSSASRSSGTDSAGWSTRRRPQVLTADSR